jgi:hypothetical protein
VSGEPGLGLQLETSRETRRNLEASVLPLSPQPALLRFDARITQEGDADVPATWAAAR